MQASNEHPLFVPRRFNSYTAYSIGCFIVWGALWVILVITAPSRTLHTVLLVFLGWVIGWTSASIARLVYPPPRRRATRRP
jgi:hypothetical protein